MGSTGGFSDGRVDRTIRHIHLWIRLRRGASSQPFPHITVTDLAQLFAGSRLWNGIDEEEVRSKILDGDRPNRPEGEKHDLIQELWRIFAECWGKDPAGRVSASEALNVLQYL